MPEISEKSQKEKILTKIEDLRKQRVELEKKLQEEEEFNHSAWNTYGSELCASELGENLQKIRNAIKKVDEDIQLLEEYCESSTTPDADGLISLVELRLRRVSERFKDLEDEKKDLEADLVTMKHLKEMIDSL